MRSKKRNTRKSLSPKVVDSRQSSVGGAHQSSVSSDLHRADVVSMPDSSGANYISRNDLHVPPGTTSGRSGASQRVPYKPLKGLAGKDAATPVVIGNPSEQVNAPETGANVPFNPEGYGPSHVGEGIDTVKPVARNLNPVERARAKNNATRDMRSNLGRGKSSTPTIG